MLVGVVGSWSLRIFSLRINNKGCLATKPTSFHPANRCTHIMTSCRRTETMDRLEIAVLCTNSGSDDWGLKERVRDVHQSYSMRCPIQDYMWGLHSLAGHHLQIRSFLFLFLFYFSLSSNSKSTTTTNKQH